MNSLEILNKRSPQAVSDADSGEGMNLFGDVEKSIHGGVESEKRALFP